MGRKRDDKLPLPPDWWPAEFGKRPDVTRMGRLSPSECDPLAAVYSMTRRIGWPPTPPAASVKDTD